MDTVILYLVLLEMPLTEASLACQTISETAMQLSLAHELHHANLQAKKIWHSKLMTGTYYAPSWEVT